MKSSHFYQGNDTRAYLFPPNDFESGESDSVLIAEREPATPEAPCNDDTDSADLNEAIEWLLPEIPGWEEYFKELEETQ